MFDIVLKNCRFVIDEDLFDNRLFDVGITGSKIMAIENTNTLSQSNRIIDTGGNYILPGFIDVHSHTDEACLNSMFDSKILQGVTTEICGNCGGAPFPLSSELSYKKRKEIKKCEDYWYTDLRWKYFINYVDTLTKHDILCNQMTYAGWWTIYDDYKINHFERDFLFKQLEKCMEEGCIGVSVNQGAVSWNALSASEKSRIFNIISKYNGVFSVHLSSYGDKFIESLNEIFNLALKTNAKISLSHIKFLGKKRVDNFEYFKEKFNKYSSQIDMRYDMYPFLSICCRLENFINNASYINDFSDLRILRTNQTITRVESWTKEDMEFLNKIYIEEGDTIIEAFGIERSDMEELIKDRNCFICTDYSSCKTDENARNHNHPRAFDSFTVTIKLLLKLRYTLEDAVKKLCYDPVDFYDIKLRGKLKIGNHADIVIINKDLSGEIKIEYVLVNGKVSHSFQNEERELNGRFILRENTWS